MLVAVLSLALALTQAPERIVDVRVQGNTLTPDADIVRLAGIQPGVELTPDLIDTVVLRLRATRKFQRVEVVKRYASIADPSQILLVIVVDEGRVQIRPARGDEPARAVRKRGPPLMLLPLLGSEEGYGFTYGALLAMPNVAGPRTRLSFPLTWGGERRAGIELEKRAASTRLTRVLVGGAVLSRDNTALAATDTRQQAWVRGEREIARALRLGAWTGVDHVTFGGADGRLWRLGLDAAIDTRVDPMLSRNAVYVRTAVERLAVQGRSAPVRTLLDANAYLGGPGASIVAIRVYRDGSNEPVPGYLKVLRGRDLTLRGYRAASAAGDTTAAATVEVRLPVTSPLSIGKVGVRGFMDVASAYDAGQRFQDQRFERGIGGGVWFTATVIRLALDVAHGSAGSTRVQLSSGLLF